MAGDEEAASILARKLPQLLGLLMEDNREFTTQTFRELSHAFYLGLTQENISDLVAELQTLRRMPPVKERNA